ncbi:MAG: sigma-54 interaction domain-containing protein [Desulfovibrio sp.]
MPQTTFPDLLPCETILDSIADGVFTVDLDWNITSFNTAATRITGISKEDALGQKCWEVLHSSLCDGSCAVGECIDKGGCITNKSIYIIQPNGEKVPISISASALKSPDGELIGGVETFRDLTDIQIMRQEMSGRYTYEDIVGKSAALDKIYRILPQISKSDATVLLLGESGTGKELFAKAIHHLSERSEGPFVAVNCGALPENLLESELFGYEAGAFTDARKPKKGRFQLASGGTIFLDEIGDIPAKLQVKLLRVLQEKTFEPLGSEKTLHADVRIIAATNKNLLDLVDEGTFRQDLYYRLNVVTLKLPPLHERREDLPLLINHFISHFRTTQDKDISGVSEDVLHLLMRHDYPGNVRELENILEFSFILCPSGFIQLEHLPEYLQPEQGGAQVQDGLFGTMEEIKCRAAMATLQRNNGRKMATCRELGISKDTLRRMLARCSESGA